MPACKTCPPDFCLDAGGTRFDRAFNLLQEPHDPFRKVAASALRLVQYAKVLVALFQNLAVQRIVQVCGIAPAA